eukprot:TRINITY_DN2979_c0_g1_i1.p1 TRINITY_DN2979_c0_g1~~TRINITY_DN2979_c0_g1_i1.p1  ORF type:complete len:267 (-),score=67.80 TRINITY_DN2979_c0_g1_i1:70-870(-)
MARASSLLVAAAASVLLAAVAFVALPASGPRGGQHLRSPNLGSRGLPSDVTEDAASPEVTGQQSLMSSFLKWMGSGLLAGVVLTAMATPAQAFFSTDELQKAWSIKTSAYLNMCKDNKRYHKTFKDQLYKVQKKQKQFPDGSSSFVRLQQQVDLLKLKEEALGNRYCGLKDGIPRTIATGEIDVRGSAVWPAAVFLYTAGWIGWSGRTYLMRTNSMEKELYIDVPLALTCMASGFSWPVQATQSITSGDFAVPGNMVRESTQGTGM